MTDALHLRAEASTTAVGSLFGKIFDLLEGWRAAIVAGRDRPTPTQLDELMYPLVAPELSAANPLLIGGGFIAAPDYVQDRQLHFSWWLGPLEGNPLFGTTSEPTKLDLSTRDYADYLSDFRSLEWYQVPESTSQRHITGPYVDHLCTCDYILTLTVPVRIRESMVGVVGADVYVKRLEPELLPLFDAVGVPLTLLNSVGRVVFSTNPSCEVGDLLAMAPGSDPARQLLSCRGTSFQLALHQN